MFSQPPFKGPSKSSQKQKSTLKKRKKQKQKNKKKEANRVKQTLAHSMSAWAENFTKAATWQLKHQVAMWKSRATALEYENQILRETLRQSYVHGGNVTNSTSIGTLNTRNEKNAQLMDYEQSYMEPSTSVHNQDSDAKSEQAEEENSEYELEISDEYMAFLRQNYEYRKAREERKEKEAAEERRKEREEITDPQPAVDRIEEFKELYGESWQRIAALDSYLLSKFMSACDSEKPEYWPNIPLRF